MFGFSPKRDMNIESRKEAKVYYTYNKDTKLFHVYERLSFLDIWSYVNHYKTLEDAQEAGRSRARCVIEMGLFKDGVRMGMMDWFNEPKEVKDIKEMAEFLDENAKVAEQTYLRKVKK